MTAPKAETEFELWRGADERQKSYLVQVLHWFHYRPTRLRASWRQEEVITWELLRALEVLPQRLLVRPLLKRVADLGGAPEEAARHALLAPRLKVTPYPSLELTGSKRNCKSDIGLGVCDERPTVWIEAKTASFRAQKLREQLDHQAKAMQSMLGNAPFALITLLPEHRAIDSYPNLSWDVIIALLDSCVRELSCLDEDLRYGYVRIATELRERIESHPNRVKGWV